MDAAAGSAEAPDASWLDSMPEQYDRGLGPTLFRPFADHLAPIVAALQPKQVIELAAGTGIATAALVDALLHAEIAATYLNQPMVSWARQRVPGATWQQADAQHLDYAAASFDVVVCQFGAMFFP